MTLRKLLILRKEGFYAKAEKRRSVDYKGVKQSRGVKNYDS